MGGREREKERERDASNKNEHVANENEDTMVRGAYLGILILNN